MGEQAEKCSTSSLSRCRESYVIISGRKHIKDNLSFGIVGERVKILIVGGRESQESSKIGIHTWTFLSSLAIKFLFKSAILKLRSGQMKLALVSLNKTSSDPPLGLAYIASYLKKHVDVDVIIIDKERSLLKKVLDEKPDVVGISAMSTEFPTARSLAAKIKRQLEIPLLIGGHHITVMPSHLAEFDIGVCGEGEQTMLELMKIYEKDGGFHKDKLKSIKGIVTHHFVSEIREPIQPLDLIPFPARDLLKMKEFYLLPRRMDFSGNLSICTIMFTSRGCPYNCIFCSSWKFWGRRPRFFSPKYVVEEMKELIDKWKVEQILIYDDLFVLNIRRINEIVKLIKEERIKEKVEFLVLGKANLINRGVCELLKEMGVVTISFGLESGSEKILSYLKTGTVTVEQNRRATKLCKEIGLQVTGSFIIGNPGENEEDLAQTYCLAESSNIDFIELNQLTPLPGTELWELAKKRDIVSDDIGFDWLKLRLTECRPDLLMNDMERTTYMKWFRKFEELKRRKNYRKLVINRQLFKYLLNPAFAKKCLRHTYEIPIFLKNYLRRRE